MIYFRKNWLLVILWHIQLLKCMQSQSLFREFNGQWTHYRAKERWKQCLWLMYGNRDAATSELIEFSRSWHINMKKRKDGYKFWLGKKACWPFVHGDMDQFLLSLFPISHHSWRIIIELKMMAKDYININLHEQLY